MKKRIFSIIVVVSLMISTGITVFASDYDNPFSPHAISSDYDDPLHP